jgi:hypothetical protein
MAWIESHQALINHPKTLNLASLLKKDRVTVIGHLHCLWWWALDIVSEDGLFPTRCTAVVVAGAAWWRGKPDQFLDALIASGFIDVLDDGMYLHDWYDYAGHLIETRRARKEAGRKGGLASGETRRSKTEANIDSASGLVEAKRSTNQPPQPPQPHQPTNQPTSPSATTGLTYQMPFGPDEIQGMLQEFPGVNVNARWREFVDWIEGGGAREKPKNLVEAFRGFLKRPARRVSEEKAVYAVS